MVPYVDPNRTRLDSTRTSSSIYRLDASRANDLIAFDKASNSAMSISAKKEKERERERESVCVCERERVWKEEQRREEVYTPSVFSRTATSVGVKLFDESSGLIVGYISWQKIHQLVRADRSRAVGVKLQEALAQRSHLLHASFRLSAANVRFFRGSFLLKLGFRFLLPRLELLEVKPNRVLRREVGVQ